MWGGGGLGPNSFCFKNGPKKPSKFHFFPLLTILVCLLGGGGGTTSTRHAPDSSTPAGTEQTATGQTIFANPIHRYAGRQGRMALERMGRQAGAVAVGVLGRDSGLRHQQCPWLVDTNQPQVDGC